MAYSALWNEDRLVTKKRFRYRFEVKAEGAGQPVVRNVQAAGEALRLARLYANAGSIVYVRDRSGRRFYWSETELEKLARLESGADADHA